MEKIPSTQQIILNGSQATSLSYSILFSGAIWLLTFPTLSVQEILTLTIHRGRIPLQGFLSHYKTFARTVLAGFPESALSSRLLCETTSRRNLELQKDGRNSGSHCATSLCKPTHSVLKQRQRSGQQFTKTACFSVSFQSSGRPSKQESFYTFLTSRNSYTFYKRRLPRLRKVK